MSLNKDITAPTTAPQSPADMIAPGSSPTTAPPQSSAQPVSGGPGGQTAETSSGPGNMGLIAPIG